MIQRDWVEELEKEEKWRKLNKFWRDAEGKRRYSRTNKKGNVLFTVNNSGPARVHYYNDYTLDNNAA